MNLNIIAGKRIGDDMSKPRFAAGSGMVPEAFAIALMLCGPDKSVDLRQTGPESFVLGSGA